MANLALIKAATTVATSKGGKKIIVGILIGVLFLILLCLCCVASLVSIFFGGGSKTMNQDAEVYKELRGLYAQYVQGELKEMDELADKYEQENQDYDYKTYYNHETERIEFVEEYNSETGQYEKVEEWYCTVDIIVDDYEYQSMAYVMAYLSCRHKKEYLKGEVNLRSEEIEDFWNEVGGDIAVRYTEGESGNKPEYYIYNDILSVEAIAQKYFFTEAEQKEFLESHKLISQFIGTETY